VTDAAGGTPEPREHHLAVTRTARYATLGEPAPELREVWFACHGYGQLAARFIRHFTGLADGTRLIVAPEALSRFYLAPAAAIHTDARVGATWMTRDDRETEIADYVAYLDALYSHVFARVERAAVRVRVLGFSQGAATAARWVTHGAVRADHLILWAGALPPDIDLDAVRPALDALRLSLVFGDGDEYATPELVAAEEARLRRHGIRYSRVPFGGGHRLDAHVLARLAADGRDGD